MTYYPTDSLLDWAICGVLYVLGFGITLVILGIIGGGLIAMFGDNKPRPVIDWSKLDGKPPADRNSLPFPANDTGMRP